MKQHPKPYRRDCDAVRRFFGPLLPADMIKRDPDAPMLVKETIDKAETLLECVRRWRERNHPCHRLYDINQLLTLQWMLDGERKLLDEITQAKH